MPQPGGPPRNRPADAPPSPPGPSGRRPDDAALVAMFDAVRDELVSTLLYMLGNPDDAQDAAQEAFLKCWRARHAMPEVQNLRAWVFRVGLNAAKDFQRSAWHRKARPLPDDDLVGPAREVSVADALEDKEAVDRLRAAIAHLRPEEREVFLLRQNGELTYEQIAEHRDAPVGTVKTQMRAALQKLRKVLNPEAAESE
ncbi:MAG: RNA polymerase sigma factor [Gemmataceae bacterium]|nr:RNA polymerase sigma factor [Gemmataceae bacterium]